MIYLRWNDQIQIKKYQRFEWNIFLVYFDRWIRYNFKTDKNNIEYKIQTRNVLNMIISRKQL